MATAEGFFTDGAAYERLMGRWSRRVGETFLAWLDAPQGLRWLDVGCGNGALTEDLVARCAPKQVIAVDPSEEQLAYARQRPGSHPAEFRSADAQALPFADDSFDAAVMALVISFVPKPAAAIAEMARVVRPGGLVATYMWDFSVGGAPVEPIYRALSAIGIEPPLPLNHAAATRHALADLWTGAGIDAVETRAIRIATVFSSFDDFWDSNAVPAGPQGKLILGMAPEVRERFRAALREQLPAEADGGHIIVPAVANAIKGRVPE